jgi:excisionase family DNA binding protein
MGVSASKRKGWNEGTPEGLMTPEQVMAYLKCGRSHIFSLLRTGEIPSLKVGRLRRVRREDVERYVKERLSAEAE